MHFKQHGLSVVTLNCRWSGKPSLTEQRLLLSFERTILELLIGANYPHRFCNIFFFCCISTPQTFGIINFSQVINRWWFSKVKLSDLFVCVKYLWSKGSFFLCLHVASLLRNWCPASIKRTVCKVLALEIVYTSQPWYWRYIPVLYSSCIYLSSESLICLDRGSFKTAYSFNYPVVKHKLMLYPEFFFRNSLHREWL